MNKYLAWFVTFNFINFSWIFFRANQWDDAIKVLKGMVGANGVVFSDKLLVKIDFLQPYIQNHSENFGRLIYGSTALNMCIIAIIFVIKSKNTMQYAEQFKPTYKWLLFLLCIDIYTVLNLSKVSEFLYFNF
jgi:hypothetical protein